MILISGEALIDLIPDPDKANAYDAVLGDLEAILAIWKTVKNSSLRHASRTHGVNVAWLHDMFKRPEYRLDYQPTVGQRSDIFAKAFTTAAAWRRYCELIGICMSIVVGRGWGGGGADPDLGRAGSYFA